MRLPRFAVKKSRIAAIRELIELIEHDDVAKEFQNRLSLIETREEKFERARIAIKSAERLSELRTEQLDELKTAWFNMTKATAEMYQSAKEHNENLKKMAKHDYDQIINKAKAEAAELVKVASDSAYRIQGEAREIKRKAEEQAIVIKQNATADALVIRDQAKYTQYREVLERAIQDGYWKGMMGVPLHLSVIEINPYASEVFIDNQGQKLYDLSLIGPGGKRMFTVRSFYIEHGCKILLDSVLQMGVGTRIEQIEQGISGDWTIMDDHKPEYVEPKPVSRLGHMGMQVRHPNSFMSHHSVDELRRNNGLPDSMFDRL